MGVQFGIIITAVVIVIALLVYNGKKEDRARARAARLPFPQKWRDFLFETVVYYRQLPEELKPDFEKRIRTFLATTKVTGIGTDVTDEDRLLTASSAIIPVFGFPEWNYVNLDEVLLYPGAFDRDYKQQGKGRNILGMVGNGGISGAMILSKQALHHGFENTSDKRNVGVHEFIHLIDMEDDVADGLPLVLMENQSTLPWFEMMRRYLEKMRKEGNDIDGYAATNEAEFFSVVGEYFFERPKLLKKNHPELYAALKKFFKQDTARLFQKAVGLRKKPSRNAPCYCGSGKKYKHCHGKGGDPPLNPLPRGDFQGFR